MAAFAYNQARIKNDWSSNFHGKAEHQLFLDLPWTYAHAPRHTLLKNTGMLLAMCQLSRRCPLYSRPKLEVGAYGLDDLRFGTHFFPKNLNFKFSQICFGHLHTRPYLLHSTVYICWKRFLLSVLAWLRENILFIY